MASLDRNTSSASNAVAQSWHSNATQLPRLTPPPTGAGLVNLRAPPKHLTEPIDLSINPIISEEWPVQEAAQIPVSAGLKKLDAVVGNIMADSVLLHCTVGANAVDLRLPPSLIPAELLSYGMPVRVSLNTQSGLRRPVIEAREIEPQPKLPGQEELEAWLNTP